jgi:hypothetical protein
LGTIPEWIAGIGTALAFLLAAIAWAYDLYRRRGETRRAQARLVDAWIVDVLPSKFAPPGGPAAFDVYVQVSNGSAQAVRGFDFTLSQVGYEGRLMACGIVPPNQGGKFTSFQRVHLLDDPAAACYFDTPLAHRTLWLTHRFYDAAGNHWRRTHTGQLELLHTWKERQRAGKHNARKVERERRRQSG